MPMSTRTSTRLVKGLLLAANLLVGVAAAACPNQTRCDTGEEARAMCEVHRQYNDNLAIGYGHSTRYQCVLPLDLIHRHLTDGGSPRQHGRCDGSGRPSLKAMQSMSPIPGRGHW